MKFACLGLCLLVTTACGASGGNGDKPANTAGAGAGGVGPSGGAGAATGGNSSTSGSTSGGNGTGGSAGNSSGGTTGGGGASAGAGGNAGGAAQGFVCPAGAFDAPTLGVTPTRIDGVPPFDDFNDNGNENIEGAVWIGDAIYLSEIRFTKPNPPPSRVLKITADGKVSIAIAMDSGTNGLAVNAAGDLFGAMHKDGSVSKLSLSGGAPQAVATMFMGARFDSPNDLTFHKNGTLYFTDPSWQSPMPQPQAATRAYRVPVGGMPVAIEVLDQPNGITLNKDQTALYISGNQLKKYPVMADGSLGAGAAFGGGGGGGDGMAIDCADNLYVTQNGVQVYSPAGTKLGSINVAGGGSTTNLAFGGADHKTLYITASGTGMQKGLFKAQMNVPGFPY